MSKENVYIIKIFYRECVNDKCTRYKNLNVSFKSKKALNNINVEINNGDFIGLLGSNGAGKSTFINSITGLQK